MAAGRRSGRGDRAAEQAPTSAAPPARRLGVERFHPFPGRFFSRRSPSAPATRSGTRRHDVIETGDRRGPVRAAIARPSPLERSRGGGCGMGVAARAAWKATSGFWLAAADHRVVGGEAAGGGWAATSSWGTRACSTASSIQSPRISWEVRKAVRRVQERELGAQLAAGGESRRSRPPPAPSPSEAGRNPLPAGGHHIAVGKPKIERGLAPPRPLEATCSTVAVSSPAIL